MNVYKNPTCFSRWSVRGSVLVAYARAVYRLHKDGNTGCMTVFDIAPKYLSAVPYDEMLKHTL